jgi:hypothetical protein
VTWGVVFALNHDAVIVAVVAVNEESEEESDEESKSQDNCKRPAGLEHSASLVDVHCPRAVALSPVVSEWAEIDVQAASREVGAVLVRDATQSDYASDQGAYEAEIDERNEEGIMARSQVVE